MDHSKGSLGCLFHFLLSQCIVAGHKKQARVTRIATSERLSKKWGVSKTFSDNIAFEELP